MSNPFIDIIKTARRNKWCTDPECTLCGAHEYRLALEQLEKKSAGGLGKDLADLSPSELIKVCGWNYLLLFAVKELPLRQIRLEGILEAWLPKFDEEMAFSDFVLYEIIRYFPEESYIRKEWINKSIASAKDSKNFSLVESLLLVLKKDSFEHPDIMRIAMEYAKSSTQMRRVLRSACGIGFKDA